MHKKYVIKLFRKNPRNYLKNQYKSFFIVVASNYARVNGGFIDKIGFISFVKFSNETVKLCEINHKKLGYWLNKGAIIKPRVLYYIGSTRIK